jgi:hypothetical protein
MRFFYARSVAAVLGLACLASGGRAQDVGMPSLLPIPPAASYPVTQAATTNTWYDESPASPSDKIPLQAPSQAPQQAPGKMPYQAPYQSPQQISPDYKAAMSGSWDSCGCAAPAACGDCCCNCKYIYANGLFMTRTNIPNVPVSIDTDPTTVLNTNDVQSDWSGGFEIGFGWCFNGNQNAVEVSYWGLFPSTEYARFYGADALGALDPSPSMEFENLDYSDGYNPAGSTAFNFYEDAEVHEIQSTYNVNSVEVNVLGTCCGCGGPFGCAATGCVCRDNCLPWGFGWLAGFRYFNFDEHLVFSTDDADTTFADEDGELHYALETENNLWGVQLGGGVNRCIGCKWSLYGVGKVGVFINDSSMQQSVYGPQGYAVINTNLFAGDDYAISESKTNLAMVGQVDMGARYQISDRWTAQFGYRVVGVSGVALTSTNIAADFSDVPTIRDYDTSSTVILHGGYAGATFAW